MLTFVLSAAVWASTVIAAVEVILAWRRSRERRCPTSEEMARGFTDALAIAWALTDAGQVAGNGGAPREFSEILGDTRRATCLVGPACQIIALVVGQDPERWDALSASVALMVAMEYAQGVEVRVADYMPGGSSRSTSRSSPGSA